MLISVKEEKLKKIRVIRKMVETEEIFNLILTSLELIKGKLDKIYAYILNKKLLSLEEKDIIKIIEEDKHG